MEITLKIIQVLQEQEGVGKNGNPWKVQPYVGETLDNYPKKVAFEVFGEEKIKENACAVDDLVKVSVDIESREFNGRWYTSVRAWKVEKAEQAAQPVEKKPAPAPAAPAVPGAEEETSDLPF